MRTDDDRRAEIHSVLLYSECCAMSGRRAPDKYRRDDGSVSDDVVEFSGTLAELRGMSAKLLASDRRWFNAAGRVLAEYCAMFPW